ncbi:MAG: trehalose-phosphatase [Pseudomonadota bacterium]
MGAPPESIVATPAGDWALFLDIDGTLLEFAAHPRAVTVDAELTHLLRALYEKTGGAVALISGRTVADADSLFVPLKLCVAGQHGAERRDFAGGLHLHAPPLDGLRRAAERLRRLVCAHPGLVLEEKGMNLALHFRGAPLLRAELVPHFERLVSELGQDFELQEGKMVLEIKPTGKDKGTAIEAFMQEHPFRGRVPIFIGDDLTDEYGFALVRRLGGHSIKVGPGASVAEWHLADASAVRGWLDRLAKKWQTRCDTPA